MTHAPNSARTASAHEPTRHASSAKTRTRVVAWVVVGMLVLHVLAVVLVLSMAKWAAADTEARLALLPWAFPKTQVAVVSAPPLAPHSVQTAETPVWLGQSQRKDTSAPWSIDRAGNVVWK